MIYPTPVYNRRLFHALKGFEFVAASGDLKAGSIPVQGNQHVGGRNMNPSFVYDNGDAFIVFVDEDGNEVRHKVSHECVLFAVEIMARVIRTARDSEEARKYMENRRTIVLKGAQDTCLRIQLV